MLLQIIMDLGIINVEQRYECDQRRNDHGQTDQHMAVFRISDPQHRDENNEIYYRIPQIGLDQNEQERQHRHSRDRNDIAPKTQRLPVSLSQHIGYRHNQYDLH
ncbi:hypothetical protein D1872_293910 [compost metagenome]